MSEPQEVFDILDGLTSPTADEVYTDVREYDTRDVLAAVGATAKTGGGGGGSQPFRDLGNITAAELITNGPKTLLTPASAIVPVIILFADGVDIPASPTFNSQFISFGPFSDAPNAIGVYWASAGGSQDSYFQAGSDVYVGANSYFPGAPVVARWGTNSKEAGSVLLGPIGTWQANHDYVIGDGILSGGGFANIVQVAGTSGMSEPTWPDDGFTTTPDGTGALVWKDNGEPPVVGSVHVVALTGVPA